MRRSWLPLTVTMLGLTAGCYDYQREMDELARRHPDLRVEVASPPGMDDGVETPAIRVRLRLPSRTEKTLFWRSAGLTLADVRIENRRDVVGWLESKYCYVAEAEHGATTLLSADAILPPNGFVRIGDRAQWNMRRAFEPTGIEYLWYERDRVGAQRLGLRVRWDDGRTEDVDISYRVVEVPGSGAK